MRLWPLFRVVKNASAADFGSAEENTNLLIFEIVTLFVMEERNGYKSRSAIFRRAARQVKFKFLIMDISANVVLLTNRPRSA